MKSYEDCQRAWRPHLTSPALSICNPVSLWTTSNENADVKGKNTIRTLSLYTLVTLPCFQVFIPREKGLCHYRFSVRVSHENETCVCLWVCVCDCSWFPYACCTRNMQMTVIIMMVFVKLVDKLDFFTSKTHEGQVRKLLSVCEEDAGHAGWQEENGRDTNQRGLRRTYSYIL